MLRPIASITGISAALCLLLLGAPSWGVTADEYVSPNHSFIPVTTHSGDGFENRAESSEGERDFGIALREGTVRIVLTDGLVLTGTIVREDDAEVELKTAFGTQKIPRSRIHEIIRVENEHRDEFQRRFDAASKSKSVADLRVVAKWAQGKSLPVEAERAWARIIELDSDHQEAREELGHARLDGKWLDRPAVEDLLRKGYVREGLDLVKRKSDGSAKTSVRKLPSKKASALPLIVSLSDAAKRRRDSDADRRANSNRKKLEKFQRQKEEEHAGVDWADRFVKKRGRYIVQSNSTERVTNVYLTLMVALHSALQKKFTSRDVHTQKSPINVYRTRQDFTSITGSNAGGFFRPATKEIHAYHGTFGRTGTTFAVLCHEGTHQFQALKLKNMNNMPAWLIEGMAVYFGDGSRLDPKKGKIVTGLVPRDRLFHIQDKYRDGSYMPLKQLVPLPYRGLNGSLYADCWALCYFLFDGPKKTAGREFISRYWLFLAGNRVRYEEFEILAKKYYGGVEEMEKLLKEFILELEPEPVGKMVGKDTLDSFDYKFKVKLPAASGFEFKQGLLPNGALATMAVPDTDTQILVSMSNKSMNQTEEEYVSAQAKIYSDLYSDFTNETLEIVGVPVIRFGYSTGSRKKKDDPKKDDKEKDDTEKEEGKDEPKKDEKPEAEPKPNIRKWIYRWILPNRVYSLVCEAPAGEFEETIPFFERAATDFEVIYENRW